MSIEKDICDEIKQMLRTLFPDKVVLVSSERYLDGVIFQARVGEIVAGFVYSPEPYEHELDISSIATQLAGSIRDEARRQIKKFQSYVDNDILAVRQMTDRIKEEMK